MENLKIFYSKIMADENLSEKFNKILDAVEDEITDENCRQLVELARSVGVEITVDDIKNYHTAINSKSEILNDVELEMVAGGKPGVKREDLI